MSSALTQEMSKPHETVTPVESDVGRMPPRARIVASAIELFRQQGIRGVGVDAIAEAAESNKMTLYRHFGSKDDLVCETLKQVSARREQIWRDLEAAFPDDPLAQIRGWIEEAAECIFNDPRGCDLANAAIELKEANHPAFKVIMDAKKVHMERLTSLCRQAGTKQAEQLADALMLLVEGARVCGQSTGAEGPQQQLKRACDAMIAAYISP
ncbi:TetR/AcrR family transcriptional regulator [Phyllobacterium myrsinacearum]|uniref:AcrR family transcriptional regulator n=1 Tax=Phyllobacterium myrsinacearum TaxID=28101 RepID=A0A839EUQ5_9HYPH|nr:TetR/AcrR family transcriptional regulator [Phyllobacterium myrsinacearum]MBA8880147.1 AcrR family transcriptional regulator [Phyllobacterium myrsinacearum]